MGSSESRHPVIRRESSTGCSFTRIFRGPHEAGTDRPKEGVRLHGVMRGFVRILRSPRKHEAERSEHGFARLSEASCDGRSGFGSNRIRAALSAKRAGSGGRTRTCGIRVNSAALCQLNYPGIEKTGDIRRARCFWVCKTTPAFVGKFLCNYYCESVA